MAKTKPCSLSLRAGTVSPFCKVTLFKKGDFSGARAIHEKLLKLHDVMFVETNPIPVKAALAMMGKIEEEYRLPLVPLSSASREKLRKILNEQGLIK